MAESSRSRVTITLGRSGHVVKRTGPEFDSGYSGSQSAVGSKRSVRDRLGGVGDVYPLNNKRRREDNDRMSENDSRLGKSDLRFKLLQKNVIKQVQRNPHQNGVDLRQTLSRAVQNYESDRRIRQQIPEPLDSRPVVPPQRRNDPSTMPIHPARSANVLPRTEPLRNPQSPWTLERLKENSPDRVLTTSRTYSSLRSDDEVVKRPLMRSYDDARAVSYMSRDIYEPKRPMGTTSYVTKPTIAAPSVKPVAPQISRLPLPSGAELKSSYRVEERLTVDSFLYSLGLEKYIIPFKAEEVDMATLRQMGERDLKELGIPMGPRKKILLALLPRSKVPLG